MKLFFSHLVLIAAIVPAFGQVPGAPPSLDISFGPGGSSANPPPAGPVRKCPCDIGHKDWRSSPSGSTVGLTFHLVNLDPTITLTGLSFSNSLPAGLTVTSPSVIAGSCDGGAISAVAGGSNISLTGATLAPQTASSFTVNVLATGSGDVIDTTSAVTSNQERTGDPASAPLFIGDPLQISYAANLPVADSWVDISNVGASGAGLQSGTAASITGAICANIYAFTPDEQLVSCCSCPVTPNGLVALSVKNDLAVNTLTPAVPTALVIKLIATVPVSGSCANSAANGTAPLADGMKAFSTTIHATPAMGSYGVT